MKEIYILLTRTNTVLANLIGYITKDPYSHSSISLNRELTELYSFGRLKKNNPFLGGFIKEKFVNSIYDKNLTCNSALYSISITEEQYDKLYNEIEKFKNSPVKLRYNTIGLLCIVLNIEYKRKTKYYCAEFVGEVLKRAEVLPKEFSPQKVKPSDFAKMPISKLVTKGQLKQIVQEAEQYKK